MQTRPALLRTVEHVFVLTVVILMSVGCSADSYVSSIESRLNNLEKEQYKEQAVGIIYSKHYYYYLDYGSQPCGKWKNFYQSDIQENVNGYIKINNEWFEKEHVIFFDDQYSKRKKQIEDILNKPNYKVGEHVK